MSELWKQTNKQKTFGGSFNNLLDSEWLPGELSESGNSLFGKTTKEPLKVSHFH